MLSGTRGDSYESNSWSPRALQALTQHIFKEKWLVSLPYALHMMKTMLVGTSERVMNANIAELGMEYF